jgi:hypothetical protein
MNREQARALVGYAVDDACSRRHICEIPDPDTNVRYVGWQCGFEPMFVAVWSCLPNVRLDAVDAEDLARDLLHEVGWFSGEPIEPDYIL